MRISHAHRRGLWLRSLSIALSVGLYWSPHSPAQTAVDELPAVKADASLRSAVEECFRIQALRDTRDPTLVQVMIQVDQPPTAMGFDVSARAGDRTIPLGPMAWTTQIGWWAYDVDVSTDIKSLDFTFTPSPEAVTTLKRRSSMNSFRLKGLESIWTGEPIVVRAVKIRSQRLQGMMRVEPPSPAEAITEWGNLLEADNPIVEQFRRDGDAAAAPTAARTVRARPSGGRESLVQSRLLDRRCR